MAQASEGSKLEVNQKRKRYLVGRWSDKAVPLSRPHSFFCGRDVSLIGPSTLDADHVGCHALGSAHSRHRNQVRKRQPAVMRWLSGRGGSSIRQGDDRHPGLNSRRWQGRSADRVPELSGIRASEMAPCRHGPWLAVPGWQLTVVRVQEDASHGQCLAAPSSCPDPLILSSRRMPPRVSHLSIAATSAMFHGGHMQL